MYLPPTTHVIRHSPSTQLPSGSSAASGGGGLTVPVHRAASSSTALLGSGGSYRGPLAVWTVELTHLSLIGHVVDLPILDEVGSWVRGSVGLRVGGGLG